MNFDFHDPNDEKLSLSHMIHASVDAQIFAPMLLRTALACSSHPVHVVFTCKRYLRVNTETPSITFLLIIPR